jgi:hypothetical protein
VDGIGESELYWHGPESREQPGLAVLQNLIDSGRGIYSELEEGNALLEKKIQFFEKKRD